MTSYDQQKELQFSVSANNSAVLKFNECFRRSAPLLCPTQPAHPMDWSIKDIDSENDPPCYLRVRSYPAQESYSVGIDVLSKCFHSPTT